MKVAVVAGMARTAGIGHTVCQRLISDGLSVIGMDNQPLVDKSPLHSVDAFSYAQASITDPGAVVKGLENGLAALKAKEISVVVNNAAIAQPFLQTPSSGDNLSARLEEFDQYLQTNLRSAFLVTEACRPWFSDDNASVVHIASTRAHQSPGRSECPNGQEGYAAAKAGLLGLMHSQGQALGPRCRVNVISPGWINTEDDYVPSKEDKEWHAVGRVGTPEDVGAMVSFLADPKQGGFLTCQEIVLDGGVSKSMVYPE